MNDTNEVVIADKGESLNIQALQSRALELWGIDQASAIELGRALIAVRDAMEDQHGAFAAWWKGNDLEENRVYYCIRKAEGKIKTPFAREDAPSVWLNRANLAIAKLAPKNDSRYGAFSGVHVGSKGTTITDGFLLVRVSLPPDSAIETDHVVPAALLTRLSNSNSCKLTFAKDEIAATTDDFTTTATAKERFPGVEKIIAAPFEESFVVQVNLNHLVQFIGAAKEFIPEERCKLSFGRLPNGTEMLRVELENNEQQKWIGFMTTTPTYAPSKQEQ